MYPSFEILNITMYHDIASAARQALARGGRSRAAERKEFELEKGGFHVLHKNDVTSHFGTALNMSEILHF